MLPFLVPLGYMFSYEVNPDCEPIDTLILKGDDATKQIELLLSVLGQELDLYVTLCFGLLASVGSLLLISGKSNPNVGYLIVFLATVAISSIITALYLSYFSLRSELPEIVSAQLCVRIFDNLATHIGLWLLVSAAFVMAILYVRVRGALE
jgi:hypothetical protein